ncbi:hypothetical protein BDV24DRAFT_170047 [Aspergillus arachidicola]|uniref:Uncharacterized protein n=1 Tax=Aspergillus arachidicola TaxID=656916 RepID=A0A5N6XMV4_9EURO|nr:hypothetical protein BDV24DRAFT_170047 [Aspergillus arachidicola]
MSSAIETVCHPNLDLVTSNAHVQLGILNLFVIISAICMLLYQLQHCLAPTAAFENMENGMENWRNAWDQMRLLRPDDNIDDVEPASWRRNGFMKNASEYWLLCRGILGSIRSSASENNRFARRTLDKYDETDLSQVNDLIAKSK